MVNDVLCTASHKPGLARLRALICSAALTSLVAPAGCTTVRRTEPPRTATEQFLMSYAARRAVDRLHIESLAGEKVYLDDTYFESFDKAFMLGKIRERLLTAGARLTDARDQAEIIVEARSAGVGINRRDALLGIPSLPLPIPTVGTIETPELAIFGSKRQEGLASFALLAWERESGEFVLATGPGVGNTIRQDIAILGIPIIKIRRHLPGKKELREPAPTTVHEQKAK